MPEQQPQWLNSNNLCYISDGMGKIQIEVARVLSENTIRKWVIDPVESPNRVDRLPWCFSQQFRTKKNMFFSQFFWCVGSDFLHISHVFFGVFPSLWEKISRQVLFRWNKTTISNTYVPRANDCAYYRCSVWKTGFHFVSLKSGNFPIFGLYPPIWLYSHMCSATSHPQGR